MLANQTFENYALSWEICCFVSRARVLYVPSVETGLAGA